MDLKASLVRIVGFCLSLCVILPTISSTSFAYHLKVTRVVDGDTIKVKGAAGGMTIRLVGIDAPEVSRKKREPGQPYSQQATKYLASLVLNKNVQVREYGYDRYGRVLGVVFLNGKDINLEMIKAGLAEVYRGEPARGLNLTPYWKAEEQAREAKKGMWSLGDKYISPREWRKRSNWSSLVDDCQNQAERQVSPIA